MGSYVRPAELGAEVLRGESSRERLDTGQEALDTFESESEPEPLGTYLSGRLGESDIEPVEEVRTLRRRDR